MFKIFKHENANEDITKNLWLQQHWLILILGLILYFSGIILPYFNAEAFRWKDAIYSILKTVGETIIVGGLIAFFASYKTIIKSYREELEWLLIDPRYLANKKNLDEIWDKVSEAFCNTRFPSLSQAFLNIIKTKYLQSGDNIRCYHNYDTSVIIEWDSSDKKWIKITDTAYFCLYADSLERINLIQTNTTNAAEAGDGTSVTINLECEGLKESNSGIYSSEKKAVCCEVSLKLQNKHIYNIKKTMYRRFNIENDNFLGFRAKYLTDGMSIKISHPEDMALTLVERGTVEDFKTTILNDKTCEYRYNDVILPRQGYTIFISHKL